MLPPSTMTQGPAHCTLLPGTHRAARRLQRRHVAPIRERVRLHLFLTVRRRLFKGVVNPTPMHRDLLQGLIWCLPAIVAGVLSFFSSRSSRPT